MLKNLTSLSYRFWFNTTFIVLSTLLCFNSAYAQQPTTGFPYTDSFKNLTSPGSIFGGTNGNSSTIYSAFLTASTTAVADYGQVGGPPNGTNQLLSADASGSGYLRLTRTVTNQTGYARNTRTFPSSQGLSISFEYYTYGGSADGISFFLFDAAVVSRSAASNSAVGYTATSGFQIGSFGGSLGYAQRTDVNTGGVSKGFLGIAFDEFGNSGISLQGRQGGYSGNGGDRVADWVVLRGDGDGTNDVQPGYGAGTNYEYLIGVNTASTTAMASKGGVFNIAAIGGAPVSRSAGFATTDNGYRKARILVEYISASQFRINVYVDANTGAGLVTRHVIQNYIYNSTAPAPTNLSYGFAASTGGSTNVHEIRKIDISAPGSVAIAPVATSATTSTLEDNSVNVDLTTYAYDQNGNATLNWSTGLDLDPTILGVQASRTIPGQGTFTSNASGTVTFVPVLNYNGSVTTDYTIADIGNASPSIAPLTSNAASLTITVTPVNDPPTTASKTVTTNEDVPYTFTAANFPLTDAFDSPANTLSSITVVSLPASGTLELTGVAISAGASISIASINAASFTYRPPANQSGSPTTTFPFKVRDNGGTANGGIDLSVASATMTINVLPVNDPPAGTDKTLSTNISAPITIVLTDFGFTDVFDNPANALLGVTVSPPSAGTITINGVAMAVSTTVSSATIASNLLVYTPTSTVGSPTFTFQVQDNGGTANGGNDLDLSPNTITINVLPLNRPPSGVDKLIASNEDTPYTFLATDFGFTDAFDNNNFLSVLVSPVGAGTLTIAGIPVAVSTTITAASVTAGSLIYTPPLNANGNPLTSFTFQVKDDGGILNGGKDLDLSPNTISFNVIPVNDAPVANPDVNTVTEDITLTVAVGSGLLSNDTDVDGPPLTITQYLIAGDGVAKTTGTAVLIAGVGTINIAADGGYSFIPVANYAGAIPVITYTASDGTLTATSTLNLTITPVNDAPSFVKGASQSIQTTSGAQSVSGWATTLSTGPADEAAQILAFTVTNDNNALFTTQPSISATGVLSYTPAGTAGTATVTVILKDNGGVANGGVDTFTTQIFTITVTGPAGNTPPIVDVIPKVGVKDTPVPFTSVDFTNKYTDATPLSKIKIVSLPSSGILKLNGVNITINQEIPAADLSKITYVPVAGFTGGPISFLWNGSDGTDYAVTAKNVNITINATNSAPVAVADAYSTVKGGTLTVSTPGILTNDSDPDNNPITAIKVSDPANGTLTFNSNGSFTYVHNNGLSTSDSFTYKVNDGAVDGNTVTVTIGINASNTPPVVSNITKTGTGFAPIPFTVIDFTSKYTDPDGDPLVKVKIVSLPPNGVLKLNGVPVIANQEILVADLSKLTFEPGLNWSGTTNFVWNGSDGTDYATINANAALTVVLSSDPNAKLGLAKHLASITSALNGTHDVKFIFTAVNYGVNALENISIRDNLALAFGGTTVIVKSVTATGNLKANTAYNGSTSLDLLLGSSSLSAGEEAKVELLINIKLGLTGGTYLNSATAEGISSITGLKVTDVSTNGLKPDPTIAGDISPSVSTPIQLDVPPAFVPAGFSPNGDGMNDKFIIQNALGKQVSLEVFNRWGNSIYKSVDYKNDWGGEVTEGFFVGRDIPDGTYYYIIVIENKDKYAGFITINR